MIHYHRPMKALSKSHPCPHVKFALTNLRFTHSRAVRQRFVQFAFVLIYRHISTKRAFAFLVQLVRISSHEMKFFFYSSMRPKLPNDTNVSMLISTMNLISKLVHNAVQSNKSIRNSSKAFAGRKPSRDKSRATNASLIGAFSVMRHGTIK